VEKDLGVDQESDGLIEYLYQDLRTLYVVDWKDVIQDRERWKALTVVAKTLGEL